MSDYTENYSMADIAAELLLIKFQYLSTGTVDNDTMSFLLQTALASDGLLRANEKLEKEIIDHKADLFSKDIEISELNAKVEELTANA